MNDKEPTGATVFYIMIGAGIGILVLAFLIYFLGVVIGWW